MLGGLAPDLLAKAGGFSLERAVPYGLSLWLAPVVTLVFAFLLLRTEGEADQNGPANMRQATGRPPLGLFLVFLVSTGLRDAAGFGIGVFFNLYLDVAFGVSVAMIGMVLTLSKVIPALAAGLVPFLTRRLGRLRLLNVLSIAAAISMLPSGLLSNAVVATASLVLVTALNVIIIAVWAGFSQEVSPPAWRPLMNGFITAADALILLAVAYAGGIVIQVLGYRALFLMTAGLTLLSAPYSWIMLRGKRAQSAAAPVVPAP